MYRVVAEVSVTSADQVGSGRLLPAVGVDQLGAALARWFGVSDANMPLMFPNITNYSSRYLNFMA